jgi:ribosomal protein L16 Arg81 hydroxylase
MANEPISGAYIQQVKELLQQTLDDEQMLGEWFAQFMTEPKYPSLVGMTEELRSASLENRPVEGSETSYNHYLNGQKQD